jgi:DNA-binding response OmpR family regulator
MKEETKKKILILEDEKPLAHALELKLTHEGFDVTTIDNGELGISLLQKENFDLVVSDLIIPGMDGFGVLEMIQTKKLHVPVIVMTNLNQEEDRKRAHDLGAVDFFVKSNSTLSQIVEGIKKKIKE